VYTERKIAQFHELNRSIRCSGYDTGRGIIVVASVGARLDGSHRASILYNMGVVEVDVKEVEMDMTDSLRQHLKEQQDAYC